MAQTNYADMLRTLFKGNDRFIFHVEARRAGETVPLSGLDLPAQCKDRAAAVLWRLGRDAVYAHQAEAMRAILEKRHTLLATGTASGKTDAFMVPAAVLLNEGRSTLVITPRKSLSAYQERIARGYFGAESDGYVLIVDGDHESPTAADLYVGDSIRPRVVFTNAHALRHKVFAHPRLWDRFLRCVDLIVLDECHMFTGGLAGEVACAMRVLRREARTAAFVCVSATCGQTASHVASLCDVPEKEWKVVDQNTAPAGERTYASWSGSLRFRECWEMAAVIAAYLASNDHRTLVFTQSRNGAETVALLTRRLLAENSHRARVESYRSGLEPDERRRIEADAAAGDVDVVVSTSALEVGVDVGGFNAVIIVGYDNCGSFRQQAGRAGRPADALVAFIPSRDSETNHQAVWDVAAVLSAHPVCVVDMAAYRLHLPAYVLHAASLSRLSLDECYELFGTGNARPAITDLLLSHRMRILPEGILSPTGPASDGDGTQEAGTDIRVTITDVGTSANGITLSDSLDEAQAYDGAVVLRRGRRYRITGVDRNTRVAQAIMLDEDECEADLDVHETLFTEARYSITWAVNIQRAWSSEGSRAQLFVGEGVHHRTLDDIVHVKLADLDRNLPAGEAPVAQVEESAPPALTLTRRTPCVVGFALYARDTPIEELEQGLHGLRHVIASRLRVGDRLGTVGGAVSACQVSRVAREGHENARIMLHLSGNCMDADVALVVALQEDAIEHMPTLEGAAASLLDATRAAMHVLERCACADGCVRCFGDNGCRDCRLGNGVSRRLSKAATRALPLDVY